MGERILKLEQVSFQYPNQEAAALTDVSLSVYRGEWLAIVGHNGSGKSTLAKLLIGLMLPTSGSIILNDQTPLTEETIWDFREHIGMVFQNPDNQFVGTTVKDDVAFGLENRGIPREEMVHRIEDSISLVNMADFLDQEPHHLSGGQKQRVAIASVLAIRPSIILLDEATSMLDPKGRSEVIRTINSLRNEQEITVISITHDLEEASRADRMIIFNEGSIFAEGAPSDIFKRDRELEEIGLDVPFPVKVGQKLKEKGIDMKEVPFTVEGLIKELWT
ncbi:energy-coupling factor transport system ATP-binding protein [Bacillus mesophilus]|uniref:Energy-coupling factor ABC transporter ATP-binding protein n=1 Tax=Bacillus mesophilus TaxID=1808955 RepID=A0A6M0QC98_9BACI|nr:energy-coupling factor ABC transporter ATP-binding protein [Bacillus mesophilus]MBM7663333.1 energy-coupling factor transport system ATP-binding protein [Bacillus mesophilus]NEY73984.1 energy-coupling factor ABC transporter ATP-binding protein [Bacillus mesophilus]